MPERPQKLALLQLAAAVRADGAAAATALAIARGAPSLSGGTSSREAMVTNNFAGEDTRSLRALKGPAATAATAALEGTAAAAKIGVSPPAATGVSAALLPVGRRKEGCS